MAKVRSLAATLVAGALVLSSAGGCLVAGSSTESRTGKFVAESTFSQIEPGKTSVDWVIATLGDPNKRTKLKDDSEILEWHYSEERQTNGAIFLLFANSNTEKTEGKAFVEVKDGVVAKKWRG